MPVDPLKHKFSEEEMSKLKRLTNSPDGVLEFLGYAVNLDSGRVFDQLTKTTVSNPREIETLLILLAHYSKAKPAERTGKLVKFRDLPGGSAYEVALVNRAVQPIAETFGSETADMVEAAKLLNGLAVEFGDAGVEVAALPRIPLVYILWSSGEFPASATLLFDESARCYLPTEDLAVLAELTTHRLLQARKILKKAKT